MIYKLKCVAYVDVGKRQSACISKQRSAVRFRLLPLPHVDLQFHFSSMWYMIDKLKRVAYVDVFFFTRRRRRLVSIHQSYIGGLPPASALSFSDVDVGDAFQFINHISANPYRPAVSCLLSGLYDLQTEMRRLRRGFAPRQHFVFFTCNAFTFNRRLKWICRHAFKW